MTKELFAKQFIPIIAGTLLVPQVWADPIGPMLKIGPVLALNLTALAILDDR